MFKVIRRLWLTALIGFVFLIGFSMGGGDMGQITQWLRWPEISVAALQPYLEKLLALWDGEKVEYLLERILSWLQTLPK